MAYSNENAAAQLNIDQAQNTDNGESPRMPLLDTITSPLGKNMEHVKASLSTPHERLLHAIAWYCQTTPDNLAEEPADFTLQLQLLEQVGLQSRRLQEVSGKQENIEYQLFDIHSMLNKQQEQWQDVIERSLEDLRKDFQLQQDGMLSKILSQMQTHANTVSSPKQFAAVPQRVEQVERNGTVAKRSLTDGYEARSYQDEYRDDIDTVAMINPVINPVTPSECKLVRQGTSGSIGSTLESGNVHICRKLTFKFIKHPLFDALCALVIIMNAVVISMTCERDITHALANVGGPQAPKHGGIEAMNFFFFFFYLFELVIKLWGYGWREFFTGEDNTWNIFDFILVATATWDVIMEYTSIIPTGGGMNMTWLRLLRLLKMLKMLRVVRVLKFFSTLRMMMSSIMGSFVTLFWSCLMLALMMFIFGLCFLQSLSSYLLDNPKESIADSTVEGIKTYWNSVPAATDTLYLAITGGNDWAQLAQPIKDTGMLYYSLFIFYIAFSSFAVLNVLTGMFVDAAMKVAEQDQESVMSDWIDRDDGEDGIDRRFKVFLEERRDAKVIVDSHVTWSDIEKHLKADEVKGFFEALELTKEDAKKIYKILQACQEDKDVDASVDLETFITGCLRYKEGTKGIDVLALATDMKKLNRKMCLFMGYCEDSFNHIHAQSATSGDHEHAQPPLRSLRRCLIATKAAHPKDEDLKETFKMTGGCDPVS